jgi:outer membrane lipase/esterase
MIKTLRRFACGLALGAATLASVPAVAGPYTSMFVFGDSLSDTGNLAIATGGTQPPAGQPYFNGRFSDGPVWVETLAAGLGLSANVLPSLVGGNNYAFAGARTGTGSNPPGVLAQVGGLWGPTNPVADPNALYVVVGGGNDLRDGRGAGSTPATRQAAALAAATNLFNSVALIASRGARNILIANVPDLGTTPEAALLGLVANSSDISQRFNLLVAGLEGQLEALFAGLDVDFLDMNGLGAAIRQDALSNGGAVYGITNVTSPCAGFTFSNGAACNVSLFSDALHPSARAHALLGQLALGTVLPVPGSVWLAVLGLGGLVLVRRRA